MSDFDFDIVATTSNPIVLAGVWRETLPVAYKKSTTEKVNITFEDLCKADMMAFGSDIGKITNKSTAMYAMWPLYEEGTPEYNEIHNRLILTRVAQGDSIDKAKGVVVKQFPKHWYMYQRIREDDSQEIVRKKELFNEILIDKKPLFFKHRYINEKRKYERYKDGKNRYSLSMYSCTVEELKVKQNRSEEEERFLYYYDKMCPLLETDCVMNYLSSHIETFSKGLRSRMRKKNDPELYKKYLKNYYINMEIYDKMVILLREYFKEFDDLMKTKKYYNKTDGIDYEGFKNYMNDKLREDLDSLISNRSVLTDYMVQIFNRELSGKNKNVLWEICGKYMYQNLRNKYSTVKVPMQSNEGIEYMGKRYQYVEVKLSDKQV